MSREKAEVDDFDATYDWEEGVVVFSQCKAILTVAKVVWLPVVPVKPVADIDSWKIDIVDISLNVLEDWTLDTHHWIVSFM